MKRFLALLLCLALCISLLPTALAEDITIIDSEEEEDSAITVIDESGSSALDADIDLVFPGEDVNTASVKIDSKNFPDAEFCHYVKENYDTDGNGILSEAEIAEATVVSINGYGIESLEGIEYLRALQALNAMSNCLTDLDLSHNSALEEAYCGINRLSSLKVSGNPKLKTLVCWDNCLDELNVSHCPSLEVLNCSENSLDVLDVSHCPALTTLYCNQNCLSRLNISNNLALSALVCNENELDGLSISRCPNLLDAVENGTYEMNSSDNSCSYTLNSFYIVLDTATELITDAHEIQVGDYIEFGSFISEEEEESFRWQIINIDGDDVMLYLTATISGEFDSSMHAETVTVSYTRYNTYGSSSWEYSDVRQWLNNRGTVTSLQDAEFDYTTSAGIVQIDWNTDGDSSYLGSRGFLCGGFFSPEEYGLLEEVEHESLIPLTESGKPGVMDTSFSGSYEEIREIYEAAEKSVTTDKVFLLNILEFKHYVLDNNLTAYYFPNGASFGDFWLRDSAETNFAGFYYYYGTNALTAGNGQIDSNQADLLSGVRPACCLDFSKVLEISGSGTFDDPIVLRKTDVSEPDPQISEYSGYFRYRPSKEAPGKNDSVATCFYDDSFFDGSSWNYNHELARVSLCMAMSSMDSLDIEPSDRYVYAGDYSFGNSNPSLALENTTAKNVTTLMHNCGFRNIEVNDDYLTTTKYGNYNDGNNIGVCIGSKKLEDNSTLIAIAIRSGGYGDEWIGNFNIYNSNGSANHIGFNLAADKAVDFINSYLSHNQIGGEIKVWISGYSRGAATANLTAAKIALGGLETDCSLSLTNLYAYCFETPQGTKTSSTSEKFNGIWNIINPIDPVPKVAMSMWGYTVFGHKMYLPCININALTYLDYADGVLDRFNTYTGSNFRLMPEVVMQNYRLDDVANIAAVALGSDSTNAIFYVQNKVQDYIKDPHEVNNSPLEMTLAVALAAAAIRNLAVDWFITELPMMIYGHYPELTLAWMNTVPPGAVTASGVVRYSISNCPVDLAVYDENDELQLSIINNEVIFEEDSYIQAIVDEDGQKIICIPQDVELRIEILATGDGDFNYSVQEYDVASNSVVRTVNYYEVEISEGDSFSATISKAEEGEYLLYGEDETEIPPSEDLAGSEIEQYFVNVYAEGNGSVSGMSVKTRGEFAQVTAVPDEGFGFFGWYRNGQLVSVESEYRFLVTEDVELTAVFDVFTFESTDLALPVGRSITLKPIIYADYEKFTWNSSDPTVASVDDKGTVTAHKYGKCEITVRTEKGFASYPCAVQTLFRDVTDKGKYYYSPVYWAADNGITVGYSSGQNAGKFGVGFNCQRRELLIFLWRYAGEPTVDEYDDPYGDAQQMFNDLQSYGPTTATNKAIAWACTEGITKGYSDGGFHPTDPIERKDVMILLYRLAGKPEVSGTLSFPDCQSYKPGTDTYNAILWGSQNEITKGYSDGTFGPRLNCLREQIVTFLSRYNSKFM